MSMNRTPPSCNKIHNFGIFLKKGKRGIVQLDFPSKMILMIQRGHIKKTQAFNSFLYFESEEDLHISLRFLDGELDFDADTMEEKYVICRLLDLILEAENAEPGEEARGGGFSPMPIVAQNVLKDGALEKKGNTTITTWNRRRVKISVGEFSYFKPGEELALNVVQLRQDRCSTWRIGQNTISLKVNQRTYCFRVPNDSKSGLSVETVRDDWIKAFEQAMTMRRMANFPLSPPPPVPPPDYDPPEDSESTSDLSSIGGSPFIDRRGLDCGDGHSSGDNGNPEITASVSVKFSYTKQALSASKSDGINTTTFVNHLPPKPAKRATVYPFRRNKDKTSDRHGGSSTSSSSLPAVSRPHPDSLSDELPVTALRAKFSAHGSSFDSSGLPAPRPMPRTTSLKQTRAQTLDDRVMQHSDLTMGESDAKVLSRRQLPEPPPIEEEIIEIPDLKAGPRVRRTVFDIWSDKEVSMREKSEEEHNLDSSAKIAKRVSQSFRDDSFFGTGKRAGVEELASSFGAHERGSPGKVAGGRLVKASSMSNLLDDAPEDNTKVVVAVKKPKGPAPPPPPPAPAAPPPPPPPTGKGKGAAKGPFKLKQVHWTAVEKKRVATSLWCGDKTKLPTLDLQLLESMFAIAGKEGSVKAKKAVKQTLVDAKRAQNLGILFSGFKDDSVARLLEALSSVSEPESFQLQKMATLKRFQPTAEDSEMFKMYRQSREGLAPVDRFMLDLCEIPKLSVRIDLVLALWDLPNNYQSLIEVVQELLSACEMLLNNASLPVLLRCMLAIGNHLNNKRNTKNVQGFEISSVDKMVDLKGSDPHYSMMTYLVDQLTVNAPHLLDWSASLGPLLPRVAGYSVKAIGAEIDVLKNDLQKVKKYQKTLKGLSGMQKKFQSDVQNFVMEHERRMKTIHDKSESLSLRFTALLAWLGEPPTRTSDVLFSSLALLIDRFQSARAARLAT